MQVIKEAGAAPIKAWVGLKNEEVRGDDHPLGFATGNKLLPDIEDSALTQLKHIARLPFLAKNGVAVMPDVHAGIGSTVGSVVATTTAIVPAMAGVDLGCGVIAVLTSLCANDLPESLLKVRQQIERDVPTGNSMHKSVDHALNDNRPRVPMPPWAVINALNLTGAAHDRFLRQLGSLGGGNHFIEICLDEMNRVWVMLHSGSRGIGNQIGRYYIDKAKEECARWHVELPHQDLAFLPEGSQFFSDYIEAVEWAQAYAFENRRLMLELVLAAMRRHLPAFYLVDEAISCHHNYIARENHFGQNLWVTRKGAVRAREDDLGVIPGSMGQRSYIVRGKANPESYCSCSHGAGRAMSRTAARERFTVADLVAQTEGVECRKDSEIVDEIPGAYKDIDAVMAQQVDLVDVVAVLKAVLCVKGA